MDVVTVVLVVSVVLTAGIFFLGWLTSRGGK